MYMYYINISHLHIIAGVPVLSQENIIVEELLYLFSGIPGNYIVHRPTKEMYEPRAFIISDDVDDALKQIIQQMLPLASNYSIVRRFIEHIDMWSGQILHALVAAIEVLLKDYYVSILFPAVVIKNGSCYLFMTLPIKYQFIMKIS